MISSSNVSYTTERLQKLEHIKSRSLYIRKLLIISLGLGERHHYYCLRPRISSMSAPTHFLLFEFPPPPLFFSGDLAKLRKADISFVMSVRPSARNNSAPTGRIFMKFDISVCFFGNLSRKFKFHPNLPTITGTVHAAADRYTFLIISRSVLLRMRNVSDKSSSENQIHILC